MRLLEPVEYPLHLNTGEIIEVFELDPGRVEALQISEITESMPELLSLCNPVTRLAVDEAKRDYSDRLEDQLKTPPVAALLKLQKPKCIEFRHCPMMKESDCITTKVAGNKKKSLPICWEYSVDDKLTGNERILAIDLTRNIVHAWNQNMYVLIITG